MAVVRCWVITAEVSGAGVGSGEGAMERGREGVCMGWGLGGGGWHSEFMSRPKIDVLSSAKTEEVLAATSNPRLQSDTYRLLCF